MGKIKPIKEERFVLKLSAFEYQVHVTITTDVLATAHDINTRMGNEPYPFACSAVSFHRGLNSYVVLPWKRNVQHIVHEAFHVIWNVLKCIGAEPDEEIVAYHLDYIVGQMYAMYKKLDKTAKKGYNSENREAGRKVDAD